MTLAGAPSPTLDQAPPPSLVPLSDAFTRSVAQFPHHGALRFCGKVVSYAALARRVDEAVGVLGQIGGAAGSPVAILLPPSPDLIAYRLAALKALIPVIPLDPNATTASITDALKAGSCDRMIASDLFTLHPHVLQLAREGHVSRVALVSYARQFPLLRAAALRILSSYKLASTPAPLAAVITSERSVLKSAKRIAPPSGAPAAPGQGALTRATALIWPCRLKGWPPGVAVSHDHLAANVAALSAALQDFRPGTERVLIAAPLWHPVVFTAAIHPGLASGAELSLLPDAGPETLLTALLQRRPTILVTTAALLDALVASARDLVLALTDVRLTLVIGPATSARTRVAFTKLTPAPLLDSYTLSDLPFIVTLMGRGEGEAATNGAALAGARISIRDIADPSRELPNGERGEVCCTAPWLPEPPDGEVPAGSGMAARYLRTSDLGLIDAAGRLSQADRIDDMIVSAGYLIYPNRIEAALLEHPLIAAAAVIGAKRGAGSRASAPHAFVLVRDRAKLTETEVLAHLATRLSRIEMPAGVTFRTAFARTVFGSIDKAALRDETALTP